MKVALVICACITALAFAQLHYISGKLADTTYNEQPQVTCTNESSSGECYNGQGVFIGFHKDLRKYYAGPVSYSTIRKVEVIACASC